MSHPESPLPDESPITTSPRTTSRRPALAAALLAVVAVLVGLLLSGLGGDGDQVEAGPAAPSGTTSPSVTEPPAGTPEVEETPSTLGPMGDLSRRVPNDPLARGPVDAPVTMVIWSDYRCPFCAKYSRDIEPELVKRYVDAGTLRMEWRDLPIFGEESLLAARAGRAAGAQGKFWEFNEAAYAAAPDRGRAEYDVEKLTGMARTAGVPDITRFVADLDSDTHDAAIQKDFDEAVHLGASSTPTFSINGHPVLGAQPVEVFTEVIDAVMP